MFTNAWIRDHAFEQWASGAPSFFQRQVTATTEHQLDKTSHRSHPQRLVVPPRGFGGSRAGAFVRQGRFAYRAELGATAVADDWRIWSYGGQQQVDFDVNMLGPYRIVAGVNDTIEFDEGGAGFTATLTAGYYTAASLATELKTQMEAVGGGTYTWTRNIITKLWTVVESVVGTLNIDWASSTAAWLLGFTANDTGAVTYTGDVASPNLGHPWAPSMMNRNVAFTAWMRSNVAGTQVRIRNILLDADFAVSRWWAHDLSEWVAADYVTLREIGRDWTQVSVNVMRMPAGLPYLMWQISNNDAGEHVIDIDEVAYVEVSGRGLGGSDVP